MTGAGAAAQPRWLRERPAGRSPEARRVPQASAGPRGAEPSPAPAPRSPAGARRPARATGGAGRRRPGSPRNGTCGASWSPPRPHLALTPCRTWRSPAASGGQPPQRKRKGNGVRRPPPPSPPSFPPRQAAAAGPRAGGTGAQALLPGRALLRHSPQRRSGAGAAGRPWAAPPPGKQAERGGRGSGAVEVERGAGGSGGAAGHR